MGLVGSPGMGLRPGLFDRKGPSAFTLLGPSRTPRTLPPHPGDTPATRSTSMILLTGRLPLPRALPPVTGRREAVTCLAQPWASKTHPILPAQTPKYPRSTPDKMISSHKAWTWAGGLGRSEGTQLATPPGQSPCLPGDSRDDSPSWPSYSDWL